MKNVISEQDLQMIHSRLSGMVSDSKGCLARAKQHLAEGNLDGARLEMAKAVRLQIKAVKRYDTTGRLSSQIQELTQVREKLLKGMTWSACRKTFARGWEIFGNIGKDLDVRLMGFVGGIVGFGAWVGRFIFEGKANALEHIQGGARWARRLYRPVKAAIKTLVDPKGRQHFCDMCKGAYEVAREKAERVWTVAKDVGSRAVAATKNAVTSGYQLARTAASTVAEKVRAAGRVVADATSKACSTIGQVTSSVAQTIGASVRSGWATIKSWFS